jgi:hypothetical protein
MPVPILDLVRAPPHDDGARGSHDLVDELVRFGKVENPPHVVARSSMTPSSDM